MADKILPYGGSARGGGTHYPTLDREIRHKKAAKIIEDGLKSKDPLDAVPLNLPVLTMEGPLDECSCGCKEFTVLSYRCRGCGKTR